jgi:hypothetical protein
MSKETLIVTFYIIYFVWLLTVTYISADTHLLNLFTLGVIMFYFLFLKEKGDVVWFAATFLGAILGKISMVQDGKFSFDMLSLATLPPWLPVAWGTTVVALRKFFLIVNVGKN